MATDPPPPPAAEGDAAPQAPQASAAGRGQPNRRPAIAAFVAAVLLLVLTEYLDHRTTNELRDSGRAVTHTHEVIAQLDGLLIFLLDAESARRAYSLTGDEKLLAPSRAAAVRARCAAWRISVSSRLTTLRSLVASTPSMRR